MREKNYKTQETAILRVGNTKCLGLAKHSYSRQDPTRNVGLGSATCAAPTPGLPKALQIQVLPFLYHWHSHSS